MRLLATVAAWASCACLLSQFIPLHSQIPSAEAQPKADTQKATKSVRRCVKFTQTMGKDLESVDLNLRNSCRVEIVCSLEWQLVCASGDDTQSTDFKKTSTSLQFNERWHVNASAALCEQDWEIQALRWNCAAIDS